MKGKYLIWDELYCYFQTGYEMEEKCMPMPSSYTPNIEPDSIDVSDMDSLVWGIK
ncbi:hypothetical protein AB8U03_12240 [Clostridium sp. Mt-5]|uniref:Uncharacterized protein n=1 Tax=Clostridium moutaii TaxID=3240932 RepID=A0ABV4BQ90_9CLOT